LQTATVARTDPIGSDSSNRSIEEPRDGRAGALSHQNGFRDRESPVENHALSL
jgi:hypothetical protein